MFFQQKRRKFNRKKNTTQRHLRHSWDFLSFVQTENKKITYNNGGGCVLSVLRDADHMCSWLTCCAPQAVNLFKKSLFTRTLYHAS